jgi:transcriptional regulator with XRE-family HTH domain
MTKTPDEQAADTIIGCNLRAFRLQKNLSQEQVADAVKLTFQQVQKNTKRAPIASAARARLGSANCLT